MPTLLSLVLCTVPSALGPDGSATPLEELAFQAIGPSGPPAALHGVWQSRGYGWIASLSPTEVRTWDHSPAGTVAMDDSFGDVLAGTLFRVRGDVLQVTTIPGSSTVYTWDRLEEVPPSAATPPEATPLGVFDYFWAVMDHHYAYFDVRGVDWDARRAEHRPRVHAETTDLELWDVLCDMLAGFHDDHMSLAASFDEREFRFADGRCRELDPALAADFAAQDVIGDPRLHRADWFRNYDRLVREELLEGQYREGDNEQIVWGRIGPLGYVNVRGMGGFADSDHPRVEAAATHAVLSTVLTELADVEGLVLDITLNSGGYEEVQMALSSHFTDEARVAFRKRTLDLDGAATQTFHLFPAEGPRFLGPVCLVTSDFTVSAGEDFTLAMRQLPHVTHVGSRTRGAFSDILDKVLPNGWMLSLSNEAYLDVGGNNLEGVGVEPEVSIPVFVEGEVQRSHVDAIYRVVDGMLAGEFRD